MRSPWSRGCKGLCGEKGDFPPRRSGLAQEMRAMMEREHWHCYLCFPDHVAVKQRPERWWCSEHGLGRLAEAAEEDSQEQRRGAALAGFGG